MTSTRFLRRSGWLVGLLVLGSTVSLAVLGWLNGQLAATTGELAARAADRRRGLLARSLSPSERAALTATVPTEPTLAIVYQAFESLAARYGVTLRYNFSSGTEQDPTLVQAEAAKDSWVIPIDFLGSQTALETIFRQLETGPYLLKVHRYRFDVTNPTESVLSTTLILSGQ